MKVWPVYIALLLLEKKRVDQSIMLCKQILSQSLCIIKTCAHSHENDYGCRTHKLDFLSPIRCYYCSVSSLLKGAYELTSSEMNFVPIVWHRNHIELGENFQNNSDWYVHANKRNVSVCCNWDYKSNRCGISYMC